MTSSKGDPPDGTPARCPPAKVGIGHIADDVVRNIWHGYPVDSADLILLSETGRHDGADIATRTRHENPFGLTPRQRLDLIFCVGLAILHGDMGYILRIVANHPTPVVNVIHGPVRV